jgi:hypothetical protein
MDWIVSLSLWAPEDGDDLSIPSQVFPAITTLNLSVFKSSIDLTPITPLPLQMLIVQNSDHVDLQPLTQVTGLTDLWVLRMKRSIDLTPLAGRKMRLRLSRGGDYTGLDTLGPGVKIRYED